MKLADRTLPIEHIDGIFAARALPSASILVFVMKDGTELKQMEELHGLLKDLDLTALIVGKEMLEDVRRIPPREIDILMDALGEARQRSVLPAIEEYLWARRYHPTEEVSEGVWESTRAELRNLGWSEQESLWTDPTPAPKGKPTRSHSLVQACETALTRQRLFRKRRESLQTGPGAAELVEALQAHPDTARQVYEALAAQYG